MGAIQLRLNHLFDTCPHPAGRQLTNQEVADRTLEYATQAGEPSAGVSASLIQKLRSGAKDNPTASTLKALAKAFGVRASYFIDDDPPSTPEPTTPATTEDLEQLVKDASVRNLALRADGLSQATLDTIALLIERARALEGLEEGPTRSS
ncbi:hypothetical protein GCM10009665_29580 [Kitasatospora nipponensis]|uniref:HTH cro/C1-type domain-containing protein n=1 Tax=Kitasatospora nipponensis TaxID=258049 RepID=A0ABN1W6M7_9ACTN